MGFDQNRIYWISINYLSQMEGDGMRNKITWEKIYKDFKLRFPHLSKEVIHWHPYEFATIKLWMKDGSRMTYNYDQRKAIFVRKD